MSTHRHALRGYRNTCVPRFLVGCGLLLALQLWLVGSSVAFASAAHGILVSDSPPTPTPTVNADFARTSAPIVRLLVTYTAKNDGTPIAYCTGLGVLVKSLSASSTPNDWVLTDGSLVNKTQATCAGGTSAGPVGTRSGIEIFFNTNYRGKTKQINVDNTAAIMCSDLKSCGTGPVLIPFHGDQTSPMAVAPSASNATSLIGLTKDGVNAEGIPSPSDNAGSQAYLQSIPTFLTPQRLTVENNKLESGTPFVDDATNKLTGLRLANGSSAAISTISSMIDQIPTNTQNASPTAISGNPGTIAIPGTGISLDPLSLGIIGLIILILIILFAVLLYYRSRLQRREQGRKAAIEELDHQAEAEARAVEAMHAQAAQKAWEERNQIAQHSTMPIQPQGLQDKTLMRKTSRDIRCPQCGEFVTSGANFCPRCHFVLSPARPSQPLPVPPSSSQPLPVPPVASSAPGQPSPPPLANANSRPLTAPNLSAVVPVGSIADQKTLTSLPPLSPPDPPRAGQTTAELGSATTQKIGMSNDKTIPISVSKKQTNHLGFIVGASSDPGIKRRYKPNEDSLLAAQGLVSGPPGPQPFGLFVVADGMGGHANGQDASRLAVQRIIDSVVPQLVNNGTEALNYAQVLVDGIQSANQAVHQQNMEKRGDMGTTVTSALVVGESAYVANVGDSRTYLYREPSGLRKLTSDHSVVASLVEAGIIKPDDIYTHPKRNQIYRSLGEKASVEVDVFEEKLREGDKLLLCSDGLWDMVRDPKIEDVIKQPAPNPSMTGDNLIRSALEGGGEDNVSVIVVQIMEAGDPEKLPRAQVLAVTDGVTPPPI